MTLGIISNIAALSAQSNLAQASAASQASIYRLSSGAAIAGASDNVGGLAVGTILQTNVSTLKTALTNTAQANSMLGVADGALQGIGNLLQRQKALATQASSGSLTDVARGFLDEEFQNLSAEVSRISSNTNFNGINLIDGSLYAPSTIGTNRSYNATNASGIATIAAALIDGENMFINGATIPFKSAANVSALATDQRGMSVDITQNTTAAQQADALYAAIQYTLNYQGTDSTVLSNKSKLSEMSFTHTAATAVINMTAHAAGVVGNGAVVGSAAFRVGSDTATATNVTVNGTTAGGLTATTAIGLGSAGATTVAIDGDLNAGTFSTGTTAYTGTAKVIAQGSVGDSILKSLTTTAQGTTGVDVSLVSNNAAFVGNIISAGSGFTTSYVAPNIINAQITVGDVTYISRGINTNLAAGTLLTFESESTTNHGGSFVIQAAANNLTVNAQSDANVIATRLDKAFSTLDFYNSRSVNSYTAAGTLYGTPGGAATGDLSGSSFKLISDDFANVQVQSIAIKAPVLGASNATISMVINGETYTSGYNSSGTTTALGSSIAAGSIGLVNQSNPNKMLVFTYASATSLDLSTVANAQAAQTALIQAFGINSGATSLTFQVGTTSADSIAMQLQSAKPQDIYLDNAGISKSAVLGVANLPAAIIASSVLDNAINSITSLRASVGALESRFNYAANNLNSAIQNQDAARGTFLDTDVPSESTNFAQAQVRVQAGISVLAQANQLPQSLLKLIG